MSGTIAEPSPQSIVRSCESSTPGSAMRPESVTVPPSSTAPRSIATPPSTGATSATVTGTVEVVEPPPSSATVTARANRVAGAAGLSR